MLLSPASGMLATPEVMGNTAFDSVEHEGLVDVDFSPSSTSTLTRSKARMLCTWKGCNYRNLNRKEMNKHTATHRRCPREDCPWANARDSKEKDRHVWSTHKLWAEMTGYPPLAAQCDQCPAVFARKDGVGRHKKEVHEATKRVRNVKA
jgi:hypothetical protein